MKLRVKWRLLFKLTLLVTVVFAMLLLTVPLPEQKLSPSQAYRFYDRHGNLINLLISEDQFYRMHIPYEQLPPLREPQGRDPGQEQVGQCRYDLSGR